MIPTIGRIVLFRDNFNLGPGEHPAIVTKIHTSWALNLTVFVDGQQPLCMQRITENNDLNADRQGWRWPPRAE